MKDTGERSDLHAVEKSTCCAKCMRHSFPTLAKRARKCADVRIQKMQGSQKMHGEGTHILLLDTLVDVFLRSGFSILFTLLLKLTVLLFFWGELI